MSAPIVDERITPMIAPVWHAVCVSRLRGWLAENNIPADQVLTGAGLSLGTGHVRMPDVLLLHEPWAGQDDIIGAAEALVVVEVVTPASRDVDMVHKMLAYAAAGIPYYWIIDGAEDPDTAQVTASVLRGGWYEMVGQTVALEDVIAGTWDEADLLGAGGSRGRPNPTPRM